MRMEFDLQGGMPIVLVRGLADIALISLFGALLFRTQIAPRAFAAMSEAEIRVVGRRLGAVVLWSACFGLAVLPAWLALQAANMADADGIGDMLAAVPTVATHTFFGRLLCAQISALLLTLAVSRRDRLRRVAVWLAAMVLLLQAGHSHALAMHLGPSVLLLVDGVHLLAAGAWLGGIVPLLVVVRHASPRAGALAARWFSPMGQGCVAAMAGTAAYQGWVLVGSIPGLAGTAYGWVALVKIALFGVLVGFALANRYRFAPALRGAAPGAARRTLLRSLVLQTGFSMVVVGAAATLSQLPPSMHTQAWWPFAWQFSLSAVHEDPEIAHEVFGAALVAAAGVALLGAAVFLRRLRWAALGTAAAACIFAWAAPHVSVLLVDAYPTSFFRSPTHFSASAIARGQAIFAAECVGCHGANGAGDGVLAASLPLPPADLTAGHLWMHDDGELFWWLTHGIDNPEGGMAMPGFGRTLDPDQIWAVIDYIRAHNAGVARHADGQWTRPVQAPGAAVQCGGRQTTLADLRGRFVRLRMRARSETATAAVPGVAACVSEDATVARAYEIVAGEAPVEGMEFLIDGEGWLRAMQVEGAPGGWDRPENLAAAVARLRANAVPSAAGGMDIAGMKM